MASGNLGLITFPRDPGRATRRADRSRARPGLIDALRAHPGIGFVLVDGVVLGPRRHGARDDSVEGEDPLAPYGPNAAAHVARTDGFPHCPDIMVNSDLLGGPGRGRGVRGARRLARRDGRRAGASVRAARRRDLPWPSEPVVGADAVHRVFRAAGYSSTDPAGGLTTVTVGWLPVTAAANSSGGSVSSRCVTAAEPQRQERAPVDRDRRSAARSGRSPARRRRGRDARGRVTGPSPRSGSARSPRAPRSASIAGS